MRGSRSKGGKEGGQEGRKVVGGRAGELWWWWWWDVLRVAAANHIHQLVIDLRVMGGITTAI